MKELIVSLLLKIVKDLMIPLSYNPPAYIPEKHSTSRKKSPESPGINYIDAPIMKQLSKYALPRPRL